MAVEPTQQQPSGLSSDVEYQELAARHRELETRLTELAGKPYLSEPEQLEEATIKKRKLQLKDRMQDIVRRLADNGSRPALSV